ncbi:MAG: LptA/OstA family protein [Mesorhizobium sp.]
MRPNNLSARRLIAALAVGFAVLATSAHAQESRSTGLKLSGDGPIQIESDKFEMREKDNLAIFTGNVNVVQGKMSLKAGRMTVHYVKKAGEQPASGSSSVALGGSSDIERLEVDGKVYLKSDTQVATGDKATFEMASETMVMTGKEVVLTDGPNVLMGCKLTVRMQTGEAKLDGCGAGGNSGRIKMLLSPNSRSQ